MKIGVDGLYLHGRVCLCVCVYYEFFRIVTFLMAILNVYGKMRTVMLDVI